MADQDRTKTDFSFWYPRDHVVGVVDTAESAETVSRVLQERDFPSDDISILLPEELPERVQRAEGRFGLIKRILAGWDTISTDEAGAMRRFRSAAARGHTTIAVRASDRSRAREAAQLMRDHDGHDIWYYRSWVTEEL
jgi:hypothetical protein